MRVLASLGAECRERREAAGLTLLDIANTAGVGQSSVHRFETWDGWRQNGYAIVNAYADQLGVSAAELWHAAIDRDDP